jgi:hypothetical protein
MIENNITEIKYKNYQPKINQLPPLYEDVILPLMSFNDNLVLGGSLSLYILDIMDYDFKNRKSDLDFSLNRPFKEDEFDGFVDFFKFEVLRSMSDYDVEYEKDTLVKRTPKSTTHILQKHLIQVNKTIDDDRDILTIDFFNQHYLEIKDIIEVDYFGTTIKLNHPSVTFSAKMKYASDNRVGKQYKHFQDIRSIDWIKYFNILKFITPKFIITVDKDNEKWNKLDKYVFEYNSKDKRAEFGGIEEVKF